MNSSRRLYINRYFINSFSSDLFFIVSICCFWHKILKYDTNTFLGSLDRQFKNEDQ